MNLHTAGVDIGEDFPCSGDVMHKTPRSRAVRAQTYMPGSLIEPLALKRDLYRPVGRTPVAEKKVFSFRAGPAWPTDPSFGEYVAIMKELADCGNVTMEELTADGEGMA